MATHSTGDPRAAEVPLDGSNGPRFHALVPCAGVGLRAGAGGPKQYAEVAGQPMVAWTLAALAAVPEIARVLVVLAPGDAVFASLRAEAAGGWGARVEAVGRGGATRADTVLAGLAALREGGAADGDWVLVHDAARCLVTPKAVQALIAPCRDDAVGGLLAWPLADTLKQADAGERVAATVSRDAKWAAQTPQMFRLGALESALRAALADPAIAVTDEASAIEAAGLAPRLVRGSLENFKLTWPDDFALAERLLRSRATTPAPAPAGATSATAAPTPSEVRR